MFVHQMHVWCLGDQKKRDIWPLKSELLTVVSSHQGAGNLESLQEQPALLASEPSLHL